MPDEMLAELRPHEAAKYLRVSKATVNDLLKTGALEGWRDANGRWRVSRAACNRYIASYEEAERQAAMDGKLKEAGHEPIPVLNGEQSPARETD